MYGGLYQRNDSAKAWICIEDTGSAAEEEDGKEGYRDRGAYSCLFFIWLFRLLLGKYVELEVFALNVL